MSLRVSVLAVSIFEKLGRRVTNVGSGQARHLIGSEPNKRVVTGSRFYLNELDLLVGIQTGDVHRWRLTCTAVDTCGQKRCGQDTGEDEG
jgi:hypothetical protein